MHMNHLSIAEQLNNITNEFFLDEVREGFFVSSMMKRYWVAQLVVLAEIDRICRKHDIKWFAEYGSLLGTVRHGGYIPWDDDFDICMFRNDYERFFAVAQKEFPEGYTILTIQAQEEYSLLLGRVVNSNVINYSEQHLGKYYGCPYTVGIDIFPLDALSDDEDEEEKRRQDLLEISDAAQRVSAGGMNDSECLILLSNIEKKHHVNIFESKNIVRALLLLTDDLYKKFSSRETEYVALMPFWVSDHNHKFCRAWFEKTVMMPFEFIHLPVPARYEELLSAEYGEYMHISKGGGIHNYPVYADQENTLRESIGANPYRYTMPKLLPEARKEKSLRDRCYEMADTIRHAHEQIQVYCDKGDGVTAGRLLEGCQNLAISLGTLIEEKLKSSEAAVHMLENYCELLYEISSEYKGEDSIKVLDGAIDRFLSALDNLFSTKKKEILFIPCRAEWWDTMEPEWKRQAANPTNNVYVMPVPYMIKGFAGEEGEKHDDSGLFPDYVTITTIAGYDIEKRHPDVVYIQNPYDGWSREFTVPDFFFSDKIRECTDELIYIPCFDVDSPISDDDKISTALKTFIEQPAVYYADKVIVKTKKLKELYIKILSEITGKDTKEYWEDKLIISSENETGVESDKRLRNYPSSWQGKIENKKILLYYVSVAFLMQYGMKGIDKIRESVRTISEAGDKIICLFSHDEVIIDNISGELKEKWKELIGELERNANIIYDDNHKSDEFIGCLDGYYGSPGALAHKCSEAGIPVMIMAII